MSRNDYQAQLEQLRSDVLEMSELVCDRLRQALEALEAKDSELANEIITSDHEVNDLYLELERDCIDLFALQQPVAGDLRFIASSFKIITDLERIGDLAVNLGEYTIRAERGRFPEIDINYIGEQTLAMIEEAMCAYEADDPAVPHDVAAMDDELDSLCERASKIVIQDVLETEAGDDGLFDDVSRMLLTVRDLERVGDHAVNIAARTLYMVENDDELIY